MQTTSNKIVGDKKSCPSCGAELTFRPGTEQLQCAYCNYEEYIPNEKSSFNELELQHYLTHVGNEAYTQEISVLQCKNCGANQHIATSYKSLDCAYCAEPLVLEDIDGERWITPNGLIPFQINQKEATQKFKTWIRGRWFTPNKLKRAALQPNAIQGIYIPYWTFDAKMTADYSGEEGTYYYTTQSYTDTNGNLRSRKIRKTRWRSVSGRVSGFLDDILVNASEKNGRNFPEKINFWNLKGLVSYNEKFLAGFITEKYTISLRDGHKTCYTKAKSIAKNWIRRDIGGDTQRIYQANISLKNETFKHILLPIYISSYLYKGKVYQFFINGQNGNISGKYPIAYWKIVLFAFFTLLLFQIIYTVYTHYGSDF